MELIQLKEIQERMETFLWSLCPVTPLSTPLVAAEGRKGHQLLMELTCSWGDAQAP